MKIIKMILVIALFLVALALGAQNQEVVTFNYLLAQGQFHLSTLLGIVFAAGFALSWLIIGRMQVKSQLRIHRLNRKLKKSAGTQLPAETKA